MRSKLGAITSRMPASFSAAGLCSRDEPLPHRRPATVEVGSFVPARLLPQLADTAEILAFNVRDGEQIFLAAVSDAQWLTFCDALGFADLKVEPALASNNQRVTQRPRLLKTIGERIAHRSAAELTAAMEKAGLPFAPIRRPEDLYEDEHLLATGGLAGCPLARRAEGGRDRQDHPVPHHVGRASARRPARPAAAGSTQPRVARQCRFLRTEIDELLAQAAVA